MRSLWFLLAVAALIGIWTQLGSAFGSDAPPPGQPPNVVGMGQHLGIKTLNEANWSTHSHDTYGRNRDGDDLDWVICAQNQPDKKKNTVELAVATIDEKCPTSAPVDRGTARVIRVDDVMPDLVSPVNRTAYMVTKDFPNASLIFDHEKKSITSNLENYKVCTQSLAPGKLWEGEPLTFRVAPYEKAC